MTLQLGGIKFVYKQSWKIHIQDYTIQFGYSSELCDLNIDFDVIPVNLPDLYKINNQVVCHGLIHNKTYLYVHPVGVLISGQMPIQDILTVCQKLKPQYILDRYGVIWNIPDLVVHYVKHYT